MGLARGRIEEIAGDAWSALRRRPRLVFLGSCLAVLVAAWWGSQRFADHLMATLPASDAVVPPKPLSEAELQHQIDEAKRINDQLRANREVRAYSMEGVSGALRDSLALPDGAPPRPAVASAAPLRGAPDPSAFVAVDDPAEPIYTVKAPYPDIARQAGVEGTVIVQALVGPDGRVHDTRILRSIPVLNGAAQDAVRQWRFKPATVGGAPVATWISVPMAFRR